MLSPSRVLALAAASVVLAGCESTFPQDLEKFCRVVGEVDAQAGLTAAAKLSKIAERKPEYANYGLLDTRDIWAEAEAQGGEDRYRYLVAAAKKLKAPDWRCPAYATLLNIEAVEKMAGASAAPAKAADAAADAAGVAGVPPPIARPAASVAAADKAEKADDQGTPKKKKAKGKRSSRSKKSRS